jgi:hypothetical protein
VVQKYPDPQSGDVSERWTRAPPQYRPITITPEIRIRRLVAIATFPAPNLACMWSNARRSTGCAA